VKLISEQLSDVRFDATTALSATSNEVLSVIGDFSFKLKNIQSLE